MNEIMKIGNQEITVKEYKGQRVITFKDIDLCHERPEGTASRNFRENKKFFIEGEDYFYLEGDELKAYKQATNFVGCYAKELILITRQGYLMVTKSLKDDLAWAVHRELVNGYFNKCQEEPDLSSLSPQTQAIVSQTQAIVKLELRQNQQAEEIERVNADLQDFKQDIPLLGVEEVKVSNAVKKKGVACLGGKQSAAYSDNSLRGKVYADIHRQLKREFGVTTYKAIKRRECDLALEMIAAYDLPHVLREQIEAANRQIAL